VSLARRIFFLLLALVAVLGWIGCGGGCATTTLSTGGAPSGGPTGGLSTGGTVCGPGTAGSGGNSAAFLYYLGTTIFWAPASARPGLLPYSLPSRRRRFRAARA